MTNGIGLAKKWSQPDGNLVPVREIGRTGCVPSKNRKMYLSVVIP
jgi:hypothetical protein